MTNTIENARNELRAYKRESLRLKSIALIILVLNVAALVLLLIMKSLENYWATE